MSLDVPRVVDNSISRVFTSCAIIAIINGSFLQIISEIIVLNTHYFPTDASAITKRNALIVLASMGSFGKLGKTMNVWLTSTICSFLRYKRTDLRRWLVDSAGGS